MLYFFFMGISIHPAKIFDLKDYTKLLQITYQSAYTEDSLGLTKDCFSEEVFSSKRMQDYLLSNLHVDAKQKAWLAFDDEKLVGSITIEDKGKEYELRGFYVHPKYQSRGIGSKLWTLALDFGKDKDIALDIYAHNKKSISIYEKWGFKKEDGIFYKHWPEWPEGLKAKAINMRLKRKV